MMNGSCSALEIEYSEENIDRILWGKENNLKLLSVAYIKKKHNHS